MSAVAAATQLVSMLLLVLARTLLPPPPPWLPLLHCRCRCRCCCYRPQGEEGKIIILSLTRNNKQGEIGFLKMRNRACVLLSRAQHGMYILGNKETMMANAGRAPLWPQVRAGLGWLAQAGRVGVGPQVVGPGRRDGLGERGGRKGRKSYGIQRVGDVVSSAICGEQLGPRSTLQST